MNSKKVANNLGVSLHTKILKSLVHRAISKSRRLYLTIWKRKCNPLFFEATKYLTFSLAVGKCLQIRYGEEILEGIA